MNIRNKLLLACVAGLVLTLILGMAGYVTYPQFLDQTPGTIFIGAVITLGVGLIALLRKPRPQST